MQICVDIEYKNGEEIEYLEVEFTASTELSNDSYDDEFGTVEIANYVSVKGDITWLKSIHTSIENAAIKAYLKISENWLRVAGEICLAKELSL